jgi:hypothetical protein
VRYKFYIRGTTSEQWIHFRMNPPIWQPNSPLKKPLPAKR